MTNSIVTIPARKGKAAVVNAGQIVRIINTHGSQVVDTWCFNLEDATEFQSNEHSRVSLEKMTFQPGDSLYTNRRRAILDVERDTSPGVHDMLMAACDEYRYRSLGCTKFHDNCVDNLIHAMNDLGYETPEIPSPLNIFMNIPWTAKGNLTWQAPASRPGDYIEFRAVMDCIMAFSACPQDMLPVNGEERNPTEAHFQII